MTIDNNNEYDALLVVSFGGPEGKDDVIPFLENVLRGKPVPRERMLEVAEHYYHFDGISPINQQNRELIAALENRLKELNVDLPVYWGNRNWHPLLPDTFEQMKNDGITNALVFVTSAYSSYSGCRQYRENIQDAQLAVGQDAAVTGKIRVFYNHPGFVEPMAKYTSDAIATLSTQSDADVQVIFTAHSIPNSMACNCSYEAQLTETARLIMDVVGNYSWKLVYQSRSGSPSIPWLEPDVCDYIDQLADETSKKAIVVVPIGFISDHMEVLFDLDIEAKEKCRSLGIEMARVPTVGTHPQFIDMIVELIRERTDGVERRALGDLGPSHDVCPQDCCLYTPRRPSSSN